MGTFTLPFAFLGTQEIIIICIIALLVFGPQKMPEIGRQIGAAMREMRKMTGDVQRALDLDDHSQYDTRYDSHYNSSYNETPASLPPPPGPQLGPPSHGAVYPHMNGGSNSSAYGDEDDDTEDITAFHAASSASADDHAGVAAAAAMTPPQSEEPRHNASHTSFAVADAATEAASETHDAPNHGSNK